MVVLSSAVCTKAGKVLFSRQFVEMSRVRIEGLLSAFPKLMSTDKQHTFVETDNVRYVYQPLENLYLVLITNKSSNIVEDLDTLRLLARIIPEYCSYIEEEQVLTKAFDLMFAFDEVITLGYKENLTLEQVKKFMEMESHEEKLANMIKQTKMDDAKSEMKRHAQMIAKEKALNPKGYHPRGGISSDDYRSGAYFESTTGNESPDLSRHMSSSNAYIGRGYSGGSPASISSASAKAAPAAEQAAPKIGGWDLKKATAKKQKGGLLQNIVAEETKNAPGVIEEEKPLTPTSRDAAVAAAANMAMESVHLKISEKVTASITRDGAVEAMDLKGLMYLCIMEPENAHVRVQIRKDNNPAFKFTTNPKLDRQMFADANVLGLKDAGKGFPTGKPLEILRWNYQRRENESLLPLTVNCWPSDDSVSIEYSLENTSMAELSNVVIAIPIPSSDVEIEHIDGTYKIDGGHLLWQIKSISANSNSSGTLEFSAQGGSGDESSFFPVRVSYLASKTLSGVEIADVSSTSNGSSLKFTQEILSEGEFRITY
eukprot:GEZU01014974.1.p1 GENE.GEZU01014974.1~~GEZU01014974.1.p1  ORF type:complete len:571 (-),score=183.54 GEZU01014974.1:31-1653(-)